MWGLEERPKGGERERQVARVGGGGGDGGQLLLGVGPWSASGTALAAVRLPHTTSGGAPRPGDPVQIGVLRTTKGGHAASHPDPSAPLSFKMVN